MCARDLGGERGFIYFFRSGIVISDRNNSTVRVCVLSVLFLSSERELLRKSRAAKAGGRTVLNQKLLWSLVTLKSLYLIFQGDTT